MRARATARQRMRVTRRMMVTRRMRMGGEDEGAGASRVGGRIRIGCMPNLVLGRDKERRFVRREHLEQVDITLLGRPMHDLGGKISRKVVLG